MAKRAPKRDEDLSKKSGVEERLTDLFKDVQKGFESQRDRSDEIKDNWDLYNCRLGDKQFYNGTSQLAMPFVHDAVEARVTRFTNQIFPVSGRYVEVTTGEPDQPQATQALIESYVRKCKLRTKVVPALLRNGDAEGLYALYVSWKKRKRTVVFRTKVQPKTDGLPNEAAEPVDDFDEEELVDSYPDVEVISDPDICLLPAASNSIEDALEDGGSVTVLRRWSKAKIKKLIADDEITKTIGEELMEEMNGQRESKDTDVAKAQLDAAGVKERGKVAVVYETWTKLKIGDDHLLCRIYFGGEKRILGCKRNPFWNDRCPIIGGPVKKMGGTWKSQAPIVAVSDLQILANDTINEAADTAHFSAMPIVMTDPLKNPRVDTMTLGLGAVWDTSPNDTKIVTFPPLWEEGLGRAMAIKDQIFQTLAVNPSMIPQGTGGAKKRSQAEMAIEQQVDILTTADVVTNLEETILTPLVQRFAEYDHQFRDKATTIRVYGEMGLRANMEDVEPIQLNERFEFRWFGVESARNAAQMQQQIAWMNVIKEVPPSAYPNYDLDVSPMLVQGTENVFGPRIAPLIFKKKVLVSVDPMVENDMLLHGFDVQIHPGDNDQEHLQAHMMLIQAGDPHKTAQAHVMKHMAQLQQKAEQQQQPQQGASGGAGPRPGGQVNGQQRPGQQPAGAIHRDGMAQAGAAAPPRAQ
jgi:hypothetical protein